MTIRKDETALFNSVLTDVEQTNTRIITAYNNSQDRILEKIAKYRQDVAAGIIRGDAVEARLIELYKQIDAEVARLITSTGGQIRMGYADVYGSTYYNEAYIIEKSVNFDIPGLTAGLELNYPVLDTNAVAASFDTRVAGNTFVDRMADMRQDLRFGVRQAVAENIAEGLTVNDLRKRIQLIDDVYAKSKARALTVARTELLTAYSIGQETATGEAVAAGVEFEYVWSSTLDGKVRPTHAKADHQKAIIKSGLPSFSVGGVLFSSPRVLHPDNTSAKTAGEVINCRCRRLNIPFGITPTSRVGKLPSGEWKDLPYTTTSDDWYNHHYAE